MMPRSGEGMVAAARSRLVRVKTSATVAEHVVDLLFAGELRAGDRIDVDALATSLGVSRAPVREALVVLERDGLIETRYHRGAFVADFDAAAIAEGFELYGLLSAFTSRRAAARHDPVLIAELDAALDEAAAAAEPEEFEVQAREFRRVLNVAVAGPRLRALLRSFGGLIPVASRLSLPASLDEELRLMRAERDAIARGDGEGAADAAAQHIRLLGDRAVRALRESGIINPADDLRQDPAPDRGRR
jgi:DNA-binding GntR family transcriptional regulator